MISSFYPVVSGRTSDSLSRNRSLYQVQVGRIAIEQLETQLSTGRRYSLPSQDPTAAIRVIGLQRELEFRDQTIRNLDSSQGYLNVTESNLSNVQSVLNEIRGLGVEGAGSVATQDEREGWISQINEAINRLASVANTQYQDRYLFSGGIVNAPAVGIDDGLVQFTGNDNSLLTLANNGDYIAHNVTGQKALGLISDSVVSRADFDPAAISATRLADLNGGKGVSPGAIQFSDGIERVSVDLANAETVGDVMQRVNGIVKLSGRDVQLSLNNGVLQANYADNGGGTLRILESAAGRTAADLGILADSPSTTLPIVGTPLDPILRPTTLLSQLNGGLGLDPNDGLRIEQNGKVYNISLGTALTIEDLTNTINSSGASVVADITPDGRRLRVRSTQSGSDFSIGERNGQLAERLGLRTFHGQTRLDELNYGRGLGLTEGADMVFTRNDGSELRIDFDGRSTIQDVIDLINNHGSNQNAATKITASLNAVGNGIQLTSPVYVPDPLGPPLTTTPGPIKVANLGGSTVAWDLGFIPDGEFHVDATLVGSDYVVTGRDTNPQEVKGVFNSLVRLRDAIASENTFDVSRAVQLIDQDLSRLTLSRGSLGVQQQRIDDLKALQEENKIEMKADESRNLEADLAATITELTGRQAAYEASLRLLANASQLTLFNYL
jgi:flagellar hook-associated protein 3 FlgL